MSAWNHPGIFHNDSRNCRCIFLRWRGLACCRQSPPPRISHMPPAGLALASAPLWGYRVWFGVCSAHSLQLVDSSECRQHQSFCFGRDVRCNRCRRRPPGRAWRLPDLPFCGFAPLDPLPAADVVKFFVVWWAVELFDERDVSVTCLWMTGAISAHDFWFTPGSPGG